MDVEERNNEGEEDVEQETRRAEEGGAKVTWLVRMKKRG